MENEQIEYEVSPSDKSWTLLVLSLFNHHREYVRVTVGLVEPYERLVDFIRHRDAISQQIIQYPSEETIVLLLSQQEYATLAFAQYYALVFLDKSEGEQWASEYYYNSLPPDIKASATIEGLVNGLLQNAVTFLEAASEGPHAWLLEDIEEQITEMLEAYEERKKEKKVGDTRPTRKQFAKREGKTNPKNIKAKPTQGTKLWWATGVAMFMQYIQHQTVVDDGLEYSEEILSHSDPLTALITKLGPLMAKDVWITLPEDQYRALTFAINYTVCALMTDEGEKWFFEDFYPNHAHRFIKKAYTAEETLHEFSRFSDFFFRQIPPNPVFAKIKQEVKEQVDVIFPVEE